MAPSGVAYFGVVMDTFSIAGRKVGRDHPPLVIAEVGINHEGELKKALQLVDAAAEAGAEVVKFQCHITDKEMVPTDMTPGEISTEKFWDIIKRCELTADEEKQVQAYCAETRRDVSVDAVLAGGRRSARRAWACRHSRSVPASATTIRCSTTSRARASR